jgi:predicted nucleic-acid-binding protein
MTLDKVRWQPKRSRRLEAGLATLRAGGDFADGVVAHEGQWLGGEIFVTFDAKAVALLNAQNIQATLLA